MGLSSIDSSFGLLLILSFCLLIYNRNWDSSELFLLKSYKLTKDSLNFQFVHSRFDVPTKLPRFISTAKYSNNQLFNDLKLSNLIQHFRVTQLYFLEQRPRPPAIPGNNFEFPDTPFQFQMPPNVANLQALPGVANALTQNASAQQNQNVAPTQPPQQPLNNLSQQQVASNQLGMVTGSSSPDLYLNHFGPLGSAPLGSQLSPNGDPLDDPEFWKFIYENSGLSVSEFEAFGGVSGLFPPAPLRPNERQMSTSSVSSASATTSDPSASSASSAGPAPNAQAPTFTSLLDDLPLPLISEALENEFLLRSADPSNVPFQLEPQPQINIATLTPSTESSATATATRPAAVQANGLNGHPGIADAPTWLQIQQAQIDYWNEHVAAGTMPTIAMEVTQNAWEQQQLSQGPVWSVPAPAELIQLQQPLAAPSEALTGTQLTNLGGYMRSGSGESDGYASSGSSAAGGWSPTVAQSLLVQHTARQSSASSESPTIQMASISLEGTTPNVEPAQAQQQPPLAVDASWLTVDGAGIATQAPANEPPTLINLAGLPVEQMDDILRSLLTLPPSQQQAAVIAVPAPPSQALPPPPPPSSQAQTSNEALPGFSFRGLIIGPTPSPLSARPESRGISEDISDEPRPTKRARRSGRAAAAARTSDASRDRSRVGQAPNWLPQANEFTAINAAPVTARVTRDRSTDSGDVAPRRGRRRLLDTATGRSAHTLPFTEEQLADSPFEQFSEMLQMPGLSESQIQLMKDIRRRAKNRSAAQNCRKRKSDAFGEEREGVDELVAENRALRARIRRLESASAQVEAAYGLLSEQLSRSGGSANVPQQIPLDTQQPVYLTITTYLSKEPNSTVSPKVEISPALRPPSVLHPRRHQQHHHHQQQQQE